MKEHRPIARSQVLTHAWRGRISEKGEIKCYMASNSKDVAHAQWANPDTLRVNGQGQPRVLTVQGVLGKGNVELGRS